MSSANRRFARGLQANDSTMTKVLTTLLCVAVVFSCTTEATGPDVATRVASITIAPAPANVDVGNALQLSAEARDADGNVIEGVSLTWSSADASVATVTQDGLVTGVGGGTAQITATAGNASGSATVTVEVPVASVSIVPESITVAEGSSVQLTAEVRDADGNLLQERQVMWSSPDPEIASVDQTGRVSGIARGSVQITATSEGVSGTANVTVEGPTNTGAFVCTLVIGFSQSAQWFSDAPNFESVVDDNLWQGMFRNAASVDLWEDPNFDGWDQPIRSACAVRSATPDRVVFTISGGFGTDVQAWADAIAGTLVTLRQQYPSAGTIVLQPVVGGPNHELCPGNGDPIRASLQHPAIDGAIANLVGGDVFSGASPEVRTCADYADQPGHLTDAAEGPVGQSIGEFYASQP